MYPGFNAVRSTRILAGFPIDYTSDSETKQKRERRQYMQVHRHELQRRIHQSIVVIKK